MEWTGGCLCGRVRYLAGADPVRVVNCHCGTCRRTSGAAFLTFVHFPVGAFAWTGDAPTRYRSSADAERGFCAVCGSAVSMHEEVLADRVQVSLGSLDRPDLVRPDDHVWTKRQLPWLKMADDLPRFATNSDAVPSRAVADDDGGADHHGTPGGPRPLRVAGGCHCGNLELTFETGRGPAELTVRACGCSFCRRHGVRTVSDPQGRIEFVVHDPAQLNRYRFGLGTAEFLVCRICGVYVGAVMAAMGSAYAIANVNALETPEVFGTAAVPVSYDGESAAERQARRQARWTPAAVVARAGPGQAVAPGDTAP